MVLRRRLMCRVALPAARVLRVCRGRTILNFDTRPITIQLQYYLIFSLSLITISKSYYTIISSKVVYCVKPDQQSRVVGGDNIDVQHEQRLRRRQ